MARRLEFIFHEVHLFLWLSLLQHLAGGRSILTLFCGRLSNTISRIPPLLSIPLAAAVLYVTAFLPSFCAIAHKAKAGSPLALPWN
eukprot:5426214-Amphidinium_carterae.2